jgi:predicted CXXCH cytochrome family protein
MLITVAILVGCSTQTSYKTLSFFFDGVPDPNAPVAAPQMLSSEGEGIEREVRLKVLHKPFADNNCKACHLATKEIHTSGQQDPKDLKLLALDSDLCLRCHAEKLGEHKIMHGPVKAAACMWCHDPHQSSVPHLLKSTGPELCLQCHDRQLLTTRSIGHKAEDKACLDCHYGHGGPNTNLLRLSSDPPRIPVPAKSVQATQPAEIADSSDATDGGRSNNVASPDARVEAAP